ncbi:MAG: DsrE/DsrF/DrsH-like family protein [Flammeovirgaceae bacterium]
MSYMSETLQTDPDLHTLIEKLVEQKVSEKMSEFAQQLQSIQQTVASLKANQQKDKVSIVVSSHELDKLLPAFIIATGAASFGMEVHMFFTLWGILGLKTKSIYKGKSIPEKMLTMMLPDKPTNSGISRLNMLGIGKLMMEGMMKAENVASLPELMNLASELGVKMTACQMTMGIMGVKKEELRTDVDFAGVAAYIESASESKVTLFI